MLMSRMTVAIAVVVGLSSAAFGEDKPTAVEKTTYADHVVTIFRQRCGSCHNGTDKKGDIVLDNYAGVMAGGSGGEIVVGGDLSGSTLWNVVNHLSEPKM